MSNIKIFENQRVRTHWDKEKEDWFFSVVDVCGVLSGSNNPRNYWKVLKSRLKDEGSELVTNCNQLKMESADGKFYNTDVLDTKGILRLVQSIPSKNAEPFKVWLAQVGAERLDEIADPEKAITRARDTYLAKGYDKKWIDTRMQTIKTRNNLTDEWKNAGIQEGMEYAILTNEITKAWSGKTTKEYKEYKGLKKESLRDNMSDVELVLNMLAEVTTFDITKNEQPKGLNQNKEVAKRGGGVANTARLDYEKQTGQKAISNKKALNGNLLDDNNGEN